MPKNTVDPLTGKKTLEFREEGIASTFQPTDVGEPGLFNSVGDGLTYTANLFDSDDVLIGTKDVSFVFTKQLGNGAFIASSEETINLSGGTIKIEGEVNAAKVEALKPDKLQIVGGTGIYEGARGIQTVRQVEIGILDVFDVSLVIGGTNSSLM